MSSLYICKKLRLWGHRAWCNAKIGRFSFKYLFVKYQVDFFFFFTADARLLISTHPAQLLVSVLHILPLYSQYIYSLLMFVVKNTDLFELNSDIRKINARYNNDLHLPSAQLNLFQKGVFLFRNHTIHPYKCTTIQSPSIDC
jgi:hypothetical protein